MILGNSKSVFIVYAHSSSHYKGIPENRDPGPWDPQVGPSSGTLKSRLKVSL